MSRKRKPLSEVTEKKAEKAAPAEEETASEISQEVPAKPKASEKSKPKPEGPSKYVKLLADIRFAAAGGFLHSLHAGSVVKRSILPTSFSQFEPCDPPGPAERDAIGVFKGFAK